MKYLSGRSLFIIGTVLSISLPVEKGIAGSDRVSIDLSCDAHTYFKAGGANGTYLDRKSGPHNKTIADVDPNALVGVGIKLTPKELLNFSSWNERSSIFVGFLPGPESQDGRKIFQFGIEQSSRSGNSAVTRAKFGSFDLMDLERAKFRKYWDLDFVASGITTMYTSHPINMISIYRVDLNCSVTMRPAGEGRPIPHQDGSRAR